MVRNRPPAMSSGMSWVMGAGQIVEDDVRQVLELELLLGSIEVLVNGLTLLDAGNGDELGEYLGHVLADDDLELAAGELATQNTPSPS